MLGATLAPAFNSSFCSMKQLGELLLHPGWDTTPSQGYPTLHNRPRSTYSRTWQTGYKHVTARSVYDPAVPGTQVSQIAVKYTDNTPYSKMATILVVFCLPSN